MNSMPVKAVINAADRTKANQRLDTQFKVDNIKKDLLLSRYKHICCN